MVASSRHYKFDCYKEKWELEQHLAKDQTRKPSDIHGWGIFHQRVAEEVAVPRYNICQCFWIVQPEQPLSVNEHCDGNM